MELSMQGQFQGKTFLYPVRIYFSETDAGGVVYHARYLDFAEHARSEMLRSLGGNQQETMHDSGTAFVVRSVSAEFIRPARLDDLLTVRTRIRRCARIIVLFEQEIMRGEELLCQLTVKAGYISLNSGRPEAMPADWQQIISELVTGD